MFVKVCGLKSEKDIDQAVMLGYSAIGIVLHAKSPRYVDAERALSLAEYASGRILSVAVGVRWDELSTVANGFDMVQTYGACPAKRLILAGEKPDFSAGNEYYLFDMSRGDGIFRDVPDFPGEIRSRLIIAGGLDAGNVRTVIERYSPFGVDVSSGVERQRGTKDYDMMQRFITEVRNARG